MNLIRPGAERQSASVLLVISLLVLCACARRQETASVDAALGKLKARDYEGCIAEFGRVIKSERTNPLAYGGRAMCRDARGDVDGALADYTRAIELDPVSPAAFNNRAGERMRKRDLDWAQADYMMAIHLNPRYAQAYRNLGSVKRVKGDLDGAMSEYNQAIELEPMNALGYFDRANTRVEAGDIRGAVTDFGEAIQRRSSFAAAYDARGSARRQLGKSDLALEDYNQAIQQDGNPAYYYHRGCDYYDQHAWNRALADFRKTIELDPTGQDYARMRTWLVLMRLGRAQDAETLLTGALRRSKSQKSDEWIARIADVFAGQISEREFLDSVHTTYSNNAKGRECQAYFYLGSLRLLKHDPRGAHAYFERALATGQTTFFEYLSAEAELHGLATGRRTAASAAR